MPWAQTGWLARPGHGTGDPGSWWPWVLAPGPEWKGPPWRTEVGKLIFYIVDCVGEIVARGSGITADRELVGSISSLVRECLDALDWRMQYQISVSTACSGSQDTNNQPNLYTVTFPITYTPQVVQLIRGNTMGWNRQIKPISWQIQITCDSNAKQ